MEGQSLDQMIEPQSVVVDRIVSRKLNENTVNRVTTLD